MRMEANFPPISRRRFIRQMAASSLLLLQPGRAGATTAPSSPPGSFSFLNGINAYYLLVEAFRHVKRHAASGTKRRQLVYQYLTGQLHLPAILRACNLNAIRFWAFNDYPDLTGIARPGAADARLWKGRNKAEPEAFEVLGHLIELLEHLGLQLVPCLSNYWPSYGGILQYLAWTGELDEQLYIDAICKNSTEELYLENSLRFFTSPGVETLFRRHTGRVLSLLAGSRAVAIIDIMNEPRGKNPLSLNNKRLPDGRTTSDVVAQWLNRQARWARDFFPSPGRSPLFSTGEEGWLEEPVTDPQCNYLCGQGQYYEGIDLKKNIQNRLRGITIGSIHMYPHRAANLKKKNICGTPFIDRRGWEHLMPPAHRQSRQQFALLADEWLRTRAAAFQKTPWYIGEMGWSWPVPPNRTPASAKSLARERYYLYTRWREQARQWGAAGVFLWMLNGLEHRDAFYGLNRGELISVMTGRNL